MVVANKKIKWRNNIDLLQSDRIIWEPKHTESGKEWYTPLEETKLFVLSDVERIWFLMLFYNDTNHF